MWVILERGVAGLRVILERGVWVILERGVWVILERGVAGLRVTRVTGGARIDPVLDVCVREPIIVGPASTPSLMFV